jgi:hypothetical protein
MLRNHVIETAHNITALQLLVWIILARSSASALTAAVLANCDLDAGDVGVVSQVNGPPRFNVDFSWCVRAAFAGKLGGFVTVHCEVCWTGPVRGWLERGLVQSKKIGWRSKTLAYVNLPVIFCDAFTYILKQSKWNYRTSKMLCYDVMMQSLTHEKHHCLPRQKDADNKLRYNMCLLDISLYWKISGWFQLWTFLY